MVCMVGELRILQAWIWTGWQTQEGGLFCNPRTPPQCYGIITYGACFTECNPRCSYKMEQNARINHTVATWLWSCKYLNAKCCWENALEEREENQTWSWKAEIQWDSHGLERRVSPENQPCSSSHGCLTWLVTGSLYNGRKPYRCYSRALCAPSWRRRNI